MMRWLCVDFGLMGHLPRSLGLDKSHTALALYQVSHETVKDPAANAGAVGSIPGAGRCPGGGPGNPLQYAGLEHRMDGSNPSPWGSPRVRLTDQAQHTVCFRSQEGRDDELRTRTRQDSSKRQPHCPPSPQTPTCWPGCWESSRQPPLV